MVEVRVHRIVGCAGRDATVATIRADEQGIRAHGAVSPDLTQTMTAADGTVLGADSAPEQWLTLWASRHRGLAEWATVSGQAI